MQQALSDKRSWAGHGAALQWVSSGPVDFHVDAHLVDDGAQAVRLHHPVETSCFARAGSTSAADTNRVVLNDARWVRGSTAYMGDLEAYRIYMVNHESGHALGH